MLCEELAQLAPLERCPVFNTVQASLSGVVVLVGLAMVVGGVVVLASDHQTRQPSILLAWGLLTLLLYGTVLLASIDRSPKFRFLNWLLSRLRSLHTPKRPIAAVQAVRHLAWTDAVSAWWFASILLACHAGLDMVVDREEERLHVAAYILCLTSLAARGLYGAGIAAMLLVWCLKRSSDSVKDMQKSSISESRWCWLVSIYRQLVGRDARSDVGHLAHVRLQ